MLERLIKRHESVEVSLSEARTIYLGKSPGD